ncbi:MAG: hypothetical protein IJL41_04825 [Clostridia bacterium]|nr:hypothetical protein [Clostridia bacterium]
MRNNSFIIVLLVQALIPGALTSCAAGTDAESHSSVEVPETSSVSDTQSISSETPSHELSVPAAESEAEEEGSASVLLGISVIDDETKEYAVVVEGNAVFVTEETLRGVADISPYGDLSAILVTADTGVYVIDRQGNELFDASNYRSVERALYGADYIVTSRIEPENKYIIDSKGKIIAGPYPVIFPVYLPDVYCVSAEHDGKYEAIAITEKNPAEAVYIADPDVIAAYIPALDGALADFAKKLAANKASTFKELWGEARYEAAENANSKLAEDCDPDELDGADRDAYIMRRLLAQSAGEWRFHEAEELILCESYSTCFTADGGGLRMSINAIYRNGTFVVTDVYYLDY